jgi:hypothetical protein
MKVEFEKVIRDGERMYKFIECLHFPFELYEHVNIFHKYDPMKSPWGDYHEVTFKHISYNSFIKITIDKYLTVRSYKNIMKRLKKVKKELRKLIKQEIKDEKEWHGIETTII